jgi:hypothetical protein
VGAAGDLHSLAGSHQFHVGLLAGLAAGAAGRGLNAVASARGKSAPAGVRPARQAWALEAIAGCFLAAAVLVVLRDVTKPGPVVVWVMAFGGVAAAAWCATGLKQAGVTLARVTLARVTLAGGWLVASVVFATRMPVHGVVPQASLAALLALGAPLAAMSDRARGDGAVTLLGLLVSAAGIWVCVPDTEAARAVLGVLAVGLLAWWPGRRRPLGAPGTVAIVVGLGWVIAYGDRGRPGATAGTAACIGALALAPAVSRLVIRLGRKPAPPLVVSAVHVAVVAAASRWAGLMKSPRSSGLAALVVLACGVLVLVLGSRRTLGQASSPTPGGPRQSSRRATMAEPGR